jgi:hypothetical protein
MRGADSTLTKTSNLLQLQWGDKRNKESQGKYFAISIHQAHSRALSPTCGLKKNKPKIYE